MPTSTDVFAKAREHERLEQLRMARELDAVLLHVGLAPFVFIAVDLGILKVEIELFNKTGRECRMRGDAQRRDLAQFFPKGVFHWRGR